LHRTGTTRDRLVRNSPHAVDADEELDASGNYGSASVTLSRHDFVAGDTIDLPGVSFDSGGNRGAQLHLSVRSPPSELMHTCAPESVR
jgi:hypothetical protein